MKSLRLCIVCLLLLPVATFAFTIDSVIGVFTFGQLTSEGYENGFLELKNDHTFVFVIHTDADRDTITDHYKVVRGTYYVKRNSTGEPGFFLLPEGGSGFFLEEAKGDGSKFSSFCAFGQCFNRKKNSAAFFDVSGNKPDVTGNVTVTTDPPGAVVFVDGQRQPGSTPITLEGLAASVPHSLRVERIDFLPQTRKFTPAAGREIRVEIKLTTGKVPFIVRSIPATNVMVDSVFVGRTPTDDLEMLPGTHEVTLRNDAMGIEKTYTVEVVDGEPYERTFKFFGRLSVKMARPCKVFIGDVELGQAPFERHAVPAGVHRVRLVPLKGDPVTTNVRIEVGKDSRIEGDLKNPKVILPGGK